MGRSDQDWPSDSSPGSAFRIAVVLWHLGLMREGRPASRDPSVELEMRDSNHLWPPRVWVRATGESVEDRCFDGSRRWGWGNGRGLSGWPSSGSSSPPLASSWKTNTTDNEGTSKARNSSIKYKRSLFIHHNVVP